MAFNQVRVQGYYRKNGTYVEPYYRSSPDGNPYNNYSYPGNVNPYTGKVATGNPDTYLNRYYNKSSYNPYYVSLYTTNYKGIGHNNTYIRRDYENNVICYLSMYNNNQYDILDSSKRKIGYVIFSKNRKRFKAYNMNDELTASSNRGRGWIIAGLIAIVGLITYAYATAYY